MLQLTWRGAQPSCDTSGG